MKKLPLMIFVILCVSAFVSAYNSYTSAQMMVRSELNKALAKVLAENGSDIIKQDTIQAYKMLSGEKYGQVAVVLNDEFIKQHVDIKQIRDNAYMAFMLVDVTNPDYEELDKQGVMHSDTLMMALNVGGNETVSIAFRSYANCSFATIWDMSDKRMSAVFTTLAVLWMMFSMFRLYRNRRVVSGGYLEVDCNDSFGGLMYDSGMQVFVAENGEAVGFTPMQRQLMKMFFDADGHRLTKQEICDALWPKKDDASETLYTMIRRLKVALEASSTLKIDSDRGRAYILRNVE